MPGFGSKYARFWTWFQEHEGEIFRFEENRESVFGALVAQLRRVDPDLVFEFSSVCDDRREFIVSAGGIRRAFPGVTALVQEAPPLSRWRIIAFRQRQDVPKIRCGDKELDRDAVLFDYVREGHKIGLTVFIPGIGDASKEEIVGLKTIGYLLLDAVVGEYDVETKIGRIEFVDAAQFPERRRIPLRELAEIVDGLPKTVQ